MISETWSLRITLYSRFLFIPVNWNTYSWPLIPWFQVCPGRSSKRCSSSCMIDIRAIYKTIVMGCYINYIPTFMFFVHSPCSHCNFLSAPSWELLRSLGEDHPLSVPSEMPHCEPSASDERRETQGIRYKLWKVIVTMMWKLISKNVDTSQHFSILYIYIYLWYTLIRLA